MILVKVEKCTHTPGLRYDRIWWRDHKSKFWKRHVFRWRSFTQYFNKSNSVKHFLFPVDHKLTIWKTSFRLWIHHRVKFSVRMKSENVELKPTEL